MKRLLSCMLVLVMLLSVVPGAWAEENLTAEITWEDAVTGHQSGTLTVDPETEQWTVSFTTPFGAYEVGGDYSVEIAAEALNDGGLGEYFPGDVLIPAVQAALGQMYQPKAASEAAVPANTAEISWEDPVVGHQAATLTVDQATEQWTVSYSNAFGSADVGGDYTVTTDGVEVEILNDGGLGEWLPGEQIRNAVVPAIEKMLSAAQNDQATEISWEDPVVGHQVAALTVDQATEQWTVSYSNAFGSADVGGDYTVTADGVEVEILNDGGLGEWLPGEQIRNAVAPAIEKMLSAAQNDQATEISWEDPVVGHQAAALTVDRATEQWTVSYSNAFGSADVGGDYTVTADGVEVEILNDGGLGEWLPGEQIRNAVAPAIEKMLSASIEQNDVADHVHKWRNGVCKVCGLECAHVFGEGTGVCTICSMRCAHPNHDPYTLLCADCGLVGYHTYVDGKCACGGTTIFEYSALPEAYLQPAEQTGTVEELTYETFAYSADGTAGEPLTKRALVYLPYGYDASKNYNILYLLHGGGEDETSWFNLGEHDEPKGVHTLYVLDHAIADGLCDPMIVVTPTFNGNGTDTFWAEVKNELIPAVESKYPTFAKGDVSAENIKATRGTRAFAGFSMGSQTSMESILKHCTDEFGYVGSYSAGLGHVATTEEELVEALRAQGNPLYYWFNANGYIDMAHDDHKYTYFKVMETTLFPDHT